MSQVMYMNSRDIKSRIDAQKAQLEAKLDEAVKDDLDLSDEAIDLSTPSGRYRSILSKAHLLAGMNMSIRCVTAPPPNLEDTAGLVTLDLTQSAFFANDAKGALISMIKSVDTFYMNAIDNGTRITFVIRNVWDN